MVRDASTVGRGAAVLAIVVSCSGSRGGDKPRPTPGEAAAPSIDQAESKPEPARDGGLAVAVKREVEAPRVTADLGPHLGGVQLLQPFSAGDYRFELDARMHRFVTREHTVARSIEGGGALTFEESGDVHGCFWAQRSERSNRSRYATRTGVPDKHAHTDDFVLGVLGRWTPWPEQPPWVHVMLHRVEYGSCTVEESPAERAPAANIPLRCGLFTRTPSLVACELTGPRPELRDLAQVLGEHERAGAFYLWDDPADRGAKPPPPAVHWLVFGGEGGISIVHEDSRRGATVKVTATTVSLPADSPPP